VTTEPLPPPTLPPSTSTPARFRLSTPRIERLSLSWSIKLIALVALVTAVVTLGVVPSALWLERSRVPGDTAIAIIATAATWFQAVLATLAAIVALLAYHDLQRRPRLELTVRHERADVRFALANSGNAIAKSPVVIVKFDDYVYPQSALSDPAFSTHWRVAHPVRRRPRGTTWTHTVVRWGSANRVVHPGARWLLPPLPTPVILQPRTKTPKPGIHVLRGSVSWTCDGAPMTRAEIEFDL